MVNTLSMQKEFLHNYGPVPDLDALFYAVRDHVADKIANHKIDGQRYDNRLIGFSWKMQYTTERYSNGRSIAEECARYTSAGNTVLNDNASYSGTVFIRAAKRMLWLGSVSNLFKGSMVTLGTGGYSTYNGPWNEFGKKCNELEVGIPYSQIEHLETYAYSNQFFLSDFPDLGQMAVMAKLSDTMLQKDITNLWEEDGLAEADKAYIEKLTNLYEKVS